jgi:hypothetical protein
MNKRSGKITIEGHVTMYSLDTDVEIVVKKGGILTLGQVRSNPSNIIIKQG